MKTTTRILLADDEPITRALVADRLSHLYHVAVAASGEEAIQHLARQSFDLVITDASISDMKASEVISQACQRYPNTKTALITADSIEDCIRFAIDHDVGTIITKTIPFDLDELMRVVKGILTENVFGLGKYLFPDASVTEYWVRRSSHIGRVRDRILQHDVIRSWPEQRKYALRLALDESITNAAYHGNQIPKGTAYSFSRDQAVQVIYGEDSEKIGVAVVDQAGCLDKQTILGRLVSCMSMDEEALARESGRGLFLILNIVHRLIINIRKGSRTEIIMLFRPDRREIGHRPIIINEL